MIQGKHIRELRNKLGYQATQVANELNISRQQVYNVEAQREREVPKSFQEWYKRRSQEKTPA